MRHKKFTTCTKCAAPLGKGNTSGRCRKCGPREAAQRRRQDNAEFAMLVQACQMAGWAARGRLRNFLDEEKRRTDIALAGVIGTPLTARISVSLTPEQLDGIWWREQHRTKLPPLAFEVENGHIHLKFSNELFQNHTPAEIRSHFELALRGECPDLAIEWITD